MLSPASAPIASVAVVGAGLMGRRIAGVMARAGLPTVITDAQTSVLTDAVSDAQAMCPGREALIRQVASLTDAVEDAELVIEAVVEDVDVKRQVFAAIREAVPEAVIATNSSVIPVSVIVTDLPGADRTVGMHWWNPPDLIPVVEVICGEATSQDTMERCLEVLTRVGKVPVRVERDVPGFVGNRLQHALWREAIDLVATGVCDAETVDLVVRNTIGLRLAEMGPIENADYVGLDLTLAIHSQVLPSLNRDPHPSPYLEKLVADGHLGAKSGSGFLTWPAGSREAAAARLSTHIQRQLASRTSSENEHD